MNLTTEHSGNVVCVNPVEVKSCHLTTLNYKQYDVTRYGVRQHTLDCGNTAMPIFAMSGNPGAELCAFYSRGTASIYSTLTGQKVAKIETQTNRVSLGSQTVAWCANGGVMACRLVEPNVVVWVVKGPGGCMRIANSMIDCLVVISSSGGTLVTHHVDLGAVDWARNRVTNLSSAESRLHIDPPLHLSPLTYTPLNKYATFLVISQMQLMACKYNIETSETQMVDIKVCINQENEIPYLSQSCVAVNDCSICACLAFTDTGVRPTYRLLVQNSTGQSNEVNLPSATRVFENNGNFYICNSKGVFVLKEMEGLHVKIPYCTQKTLGNIVRKNKCDRCQDYNDDPFYVQGRVCKLCKTPGTSSYAYGAALDYAKRNFNFMPDAVTRENLRLLWDYKNTCVWSDASYTKVKLVFAPINMLLPMSNVNVMLVGRQLAHTSRTGVVIKLAKTRLAKSKLPRSSE